MREKELEKEFKDYLSKDYKQFNKQIIHLDKKITTEKEFANFSEEDLRKRQYLSGYSIEDLELILHPMVEDAKEATGSMGDDTPVAVLSNHYRPISHYFRQNFSQVTNPPIDSLRENKVMSLKTRFGNLGNILDFDNNNLKLKSRSSVTVSSLKEPHDNNVSFLINWPFPLNSETPATDNLPY